MTTFVYTSIRLEKPSDPYTKRLVRVWRVGRGEPKLIAHRVATHNDAWQIVMTILRDHKAVPKWLSQNKVGLPTRYHLEKAKINVFCLSDDTPHTLKQHAKEA